MTARAFLSGAARRPPRRLRHLPRRSPSVNPTSRRDRPRGVGAAPAPHSERRRPAEAARHPHDDDEDGTVVSRAQPAHLGPAHRHPRRRHRPRRHRRPGRRRARRPPRPLVARPVDRPGRADRLRRGRPGAVPEVPRHPTGRRQRRHHRRPHQLVLRLPADLVVAAALARCWRCGCAEQPRRVRRGALRRRRCTSSSMVVAGAADADRQRDRRLPGRHPLVLPPRLADHPGDDVGRDRRAASPGWSAGSTASTTAATQRRELAASL